MAFQLTTLFGDWGATVGSFANTEEMRDGLQSLVSARRTKKCFAKREHSEHE